MTWTQLKVPCGLAVLVFAICGAVASQTAQAQQRFLPAKESKSLPAKNDREAEREALKKEIEALQKKYEALGKKEEQAPQRIVVTRPMATDLVITQQYVGKIHSQRHIEVHALANGFLEAIPIREGQTVRQGDVMFKVLPILYQAKLDAEKAELQIAQIEFSNTKKLFEQKVVSVHEVALSQAKLARAQAKATLAEALLNFTAVKAPFDGIVDRMLQQQGSLIKEGDTLTTLSDNSVMRVYFNVPETRYLEYMADREQIKEGLPVQLVLANGRKFPQAGKLGAPAADFNSKTGSIPFHADFPNPDRLLRHGQSGTVLIPRQLKNVIVIPQRALFEVLGKRYVYVVGKDDVVHQREIVVQHEIGDLFVVKGIDANDKIVLEGVRRIRDGEKVEYEFRKPEEVITIPRIQAEK